jgi:hypothetical protein
MDIQLPVMDGHEPSGGLGPIRTEVRTDYCRCILCVGRDENKIVPKTHSPSGARGR